VALAIGGVTFIAEACQVPVFRFALERWEADPYTLTVIPGATGELSEEENAVVEFLQSTDSEAMMAANLRLRIDPERQSDAPGAVMELSYPQKLMGFTIPPIWTGPVTMENARAMIDSPVRREIVKRILAGESATWVMIESGDPEVDDAAAKVIEESLAAAEGQLKIPDGVMTREDAESAANFQAVNADDILQSEVPLKIDFSLVRLSRDEPAEAIFRTMLLNIEDDLHEFENEPIVFPVFGRGRFLEPLIGRGIHADNVMEHSFYLCGACSCEVKDQNPGLDLLVAADWDAAILGSEVVIEKILPPLEGVGALVAAAPAEKPAEPAKIQTSEIKFMSEEGPSETQRYSEEKTFAVPFTWILVIAGVLFALVFGTAMILRRNR